VTFSTGKFARKTRFSAAGFGGVFSRLKKTIKTLFFFVVICGGVAVFFQIFTPQIGFLIRNCWGPHHGSHTHC